MMSSVLISLVAVFFLLMGVYALATPAGLAEPFGIVVQTPVARSEIRAVYGGFGIAIAVLLGAAAVDIGDIRRGAVIAVAAALGGMALGRIVSRASTARSASTPAGSTAGWSWRRRRCCV